MGTDARSAFIKAKLERIKAEGVRRNTHAPVSASNPRQPVSHARAVAITLNKARERGYNIPEPKKKIDKDGDYQRNHQDRTLEGEMM